MPEPGAPPYVARIISLRCQPADLDRLLTIYRTTSMPMVKGMPGLILVVGVASSSTGHASSITIWQSPEDRERGGISAESAANLSLYSPLMVGSYIRDAYDVPLFHLPEFPAGERSDVLTRITTHDIEPGHWHDATTRLRALASDLASTHAAGYGLTVFESQALSRALLIEFATSPAALVPPQIAIRRHNSEARTLRHVRRPPTTEHFDITDLP
jgi:hypothetical protein